MKGLSREKAPGPPPKTRHRIRSPELVASPRATQAQGRYGRKVIYFGSVQESRDEAPMRIAFTHIPDAGPEGD